MPRGGLTSTQNERVRGYVRQVLALEKGSQAATARRLESKSLSRFLAGQTGTSYRMVARLSKVLKIPPHEILGEPSPVPPLPAPPELAALLVRDFGVGEEAIQSVLADHQGEDHPVLWWTDRMRMKAIEQLQQMAPAHAWPATQRMPQGHAHAEGKAPSKTGPLERVARAPSAARHPDEHDHDRAPPSKSGEVKRAKERTG